MSKPLARTYSLRKHVRPLVDIDEEDDDQRRDSSGRKRVDVVQCLLDSSSDEIDDGITDIIKTNSSVLWLTFYEICHIRCVLAQLTLSLDKQYSQIRRDRLCFRCRKKINEFSFLPSFLGFSNHEICFICQQTICKKCSYSNFLSPSTKLSIPVRLQTLIKPSTNPIESKEEKINKSNPQTRTVCHDCLQVFNERIQTSQQHITTPPGSPLRRTYSLPPLSSKTSNETRHTRHRRRPLQITNCKIEKTTITTTSFITEF